MNCKICDKLVISTAVNWDGTSLIIALPSGSFRDGETFCLVVAQSRPATATVDAPVVLTIGADSTQYPLTSCGCKPVTACQIGTRKRYPVLISTTPTGAVFRLMRRTGCCSNNLQAVGG